jgi:2'-5' RNA ligase
MSIASKPMFLSLDPDPTIGALVLRHKHEVRALVGNQLYLNDPPHVTLYLALFSSRRKVIDLATELVENLTPPEVTISGWHVFERDQLTGNQTLVFQFSPVCIAQLQAVQQSALRCLGPERDRRATEARYASRLEALSPVEQRSIQEFGFPFTGKQWHPHLTIASIQPTAWQRVADCLLSETPRAKGQFDSLTVFELDGLEPIALESFSLRTCEVPT